MRSHQLVEASSEDAAVEVHKASHGLVPHKMIEVTRPTVSQFMGDWERNVPYEARTEGPSSTIDSGLRAIVFTDLEGSTDVSSHLGDDKAMELLTFHDQIVRAALAEHGGREIKHTGDGIMSSFSKAVSSAVDIQRAFVGAAKAPVDEVGVRIGMSAGEPVDQSDDIFGASVSLASRICAYADAGQILVSSAVREMSIGKGIAFADCGPIALKGFDEPIRLYAVRYD